MLRAFQHRNYRLFFSGHGISLIGTWMQRIAMSWLVYRLTDSAFLLGLVGFTNHIPTFLCAPFAGVFADRWNRQHALMVTQGLAMVQALLLGWLTLTGMIQIWHIILLSLFHGFIRALDIPIRHSFVLEMVEKKEDLGNAIALNSSMFNSARLIGPSLAGIVITLVGEGICFLLNALSYLAILLALKAMIIPPKTQLSGRSSPLWQGVKEGFTYVLNFTPIRSILLLLSLASLLAMPYTVILPIFAKDILRSGPSTLGFLMAGVGVGALTGAFFLAARKNVLGLENWIVRAACIFGGGLIVFSFSRVVWLSILLMVFTGFGMMVQTTTSNTLLQTIADDDKRGRIMSYYMLAMGGMTPFGSLLAGGLASTIGAPNTLLIGGIACLLGATLFAKQLPTFRNMVYPIYARIGVMPEGALETPSKKIS